MSGLMGCVTGEASEDDINSWLDRRRRENGGLRWRITEDGEVIYLARGSDRCQTGIEESCDHSIIFGG